MLIFVLAYLLSVWWLRQRLNFVLGGAGAYGKKLRLIFEGVVGLGRHKELGEGGVKGTTNIFFMLAAVAVAKQSCVPFLLIMKPSLSSMVKMM